MSTIASDSKLFHHDNNIYEHLRMYAASNCPLLCHKGDTYIIKANCTSENSTYIPVPCI